MEEGKKNEQSLMKCQKKGIAKGQQRTIESLPSFILIENDVFVFDFIFDNTLKIGKHYFTMILLTGDE